MNVTNSKLLDHEFLAGMYGDGYFPAFLVDKVKAILLDLCYQIEAQAPPDNEGLLKLTHAATERINDLQDEFLENDSELETVAREVMGAEFEQIARAYGFSDVDVEDLVATRDW